MKNKFVLLVLLLLSGLVSSQEKMTQEQISFLQKKVRQTARATKSIVSDFTETKHMDILDDSVEHTGKLYYLAPDHIRWEYTYPQTNVAIFKEETMLVANNGMPEVIDLSSNKLFRSFNQLIVNSISGNMFNDDQFTIEYLKFDEGYAVTFMPKDRRLQRFVSSFELLFDTASGAVIQIKLIEPNDDYTRIQFKNRMTNVLVGEDKFKL